MPSNRRSQARTIADLARLVLCMVGGVPLLAVPKALTTQAKTTQYPQPSGVTPSAVAFAQSDE